jgi:hypothetical protein
VPVSQYGILFDGRYDSLPLNTLSSIRSKSSKDSPEAASILPANFHLCESSIAPRPDEFKRCANTRMYSGARTVGTAFASHPDWEVEMKKLCASIVLIVAVLLGSQGLAEQLRVAENLRQGQVMMPASVPERSLMTIVDHIMFVDSGIAAILIFYDDKTTGRDLDYVEVYDIEGDLLLLSWIDQMGVCQAAVDRGLLNFDEPEIDGTLVIVGVGREL